MFPVIIPTMFLVLSVYFCFLFFVCICCLGVLPLSYNYFWNSTKNVDIKKIKWNPNADCVIYLHTVDVSWTADLVVTEVQLQEGAGPLDAMQGPDGVVLHRQEGQLGQVTQDWGIQSSQLVAIEAQFDQGMQFRQAWEERERDRRKGDVIAGCVRCKRRKDPLLTRRRRHLPVNEVMLLWLTDSSSSFKQLSRPSSLEMSLSLKEAQRRLTSLFRLYNLVIFRLSRTSVVIWSKHTATNTHTRFKLVPALHCSLINQPFVYLCSPIRFELLSPGCSVQVQEMGCWEQAETAWTCVAGTRVSQKRRLKTDEVNTTTKKYTFHFWL